MFFFDFWFILSGTLLKQFFCKFSGFYEPMNVVRTLISVVIFFSFCFSGNVLKFVQAQNHLFAFVFFLIYF